MGAGGLVERRCWELMTNKQLYMFHPRNCPHQKQADPPKPATGAVDTNFTNNFRSPTAEGRAVPLAVVYSRSDHEA